MRAYLHNWCALGDRIVVHPQGLPPGWAASGLTPEREAEAVKHSIPGHVLHLNPETLELIEIFPIR